MGMPMTSPENVALPPRCSAYSLPEDTMMKNVICAVRITYGHPKTPVAYFTHLEEDVGKYHDNQRPHLGKLEFAIVIQLFCGQILSRALLPKLDSTTLCPQGHRRAIGSPAKPRILRATA